jgi:ankyrin repeat protein
MRQQFDEEDRNLDENKEQTLTSESSEDGHPIHAAINWLRRRSRQLSNVLEEFPFLEYAGSNWAFHAKRQDLVLNYKPFGWLFEKPSTIFQQWKYLNDLHGGLMLRSCLSLGLPELGISHIDEVVRGEASPIHIAAYFGLEDLVISISAGSGADLESAIAVASDGGQGAIVEYFLAQVAPGYPLGRATLRASFMGHEDVVSLLLDHGAKADDGILAAGFNGRDKVVSLLLERGAHRLSHLALLAACFGGHSSTVEIVLRYRNDLPIFSRDTVSSMKRAYDLSTGDWVIGDTQSPAQFLELMETIEEVVVEDTGILADYWSPLLISSMLGQSKVVEILLKSGRLNDEEPSGWTVALIIATVLGLGSVVDVLLKCWKDGADLEVSVVYGCGTEHNLLIRTILEEMHARGDPFLRKPQALERALKAGNEEMRRMIEAYPEQGSGSSVA